MMSRLSNALRATALMGGFAFAGTATVAADPSKGSAGDINTLAASLSKGYGLNNCTTEAVANSQLAVLSCGQNPDPSGPVLAKYYLFSNNDAMNTFFAAQIKEDVLTPCGNSSAQSPSPWHQGSGATTKAGQMACGTYQNAAEIVWTNDAKKVLGYIRASNGDAHSLYQWWEANG
jgi:hypothetical protein